MQGVLAALAGLGQGYAEGLESKRKREREKELNDLRKQAIKLQLEQQKINQTKLERQNRFLDMFLEKLGTSGEVAPETTATEQPSTGLTGKMAEMQIPGLPSETQQPQKAGLLEIMSDPQMLLLGEQAGLNLMPLANYLQRQGEVDWRSGIQIPGLKGRWSVPFTQQGQPLYHLAQPEVITPEKVTQTGPFGGERTTFVNPFEAGGFQSKAPPVLSANELSKYVDSEGHHPPAGSTMKNIVEGDYRVLSTAAQSTQESFKATKAILNRLEDMAGTLFTVDGLWSRLIESGKTDLAYLTQSNPDVVLFQSLKNGILANIVRAFGERGTLTDEDIDRARKLLPNLLPIIDTEVVAKGKLQQLKDLIVEIGSRDPKKFKGNISPERAREIADKLETSISGQYKNMSDDALLKELEK